MATSEKKITSYTAISTVLRDILNKERNNGLVLKVLAKEIGVSDTTLSKFLSDNLTSDRRFERLIVTLAEQFGIDLEYSHRETYYFVHNKFTEKEIRDKLWEGQKKGRRRKSTSSHS